jgi:hypothetical protein
MKAISWMKGKYNFLAWPAFLAGAGLGTFVYGMKKFTDAMDRASEVIIVNKNEIPIEDGE